MSRISVSFSFFFWLQYFEWPLENNYHAVIMSVWYPLPVIHP